MSARFPQRVYGEGTEPDPRFSLANERTFLAWIRTALALTAAGIAVEAFEVPVPAGLRLAIGVLLVAAGIFAAAQAWLSWSGVERAMRRGEPLPSSPLKAPLAAALALAGVAAIVGVVIGSR